MRCNVIHFHVCFIDYIGTTMRNHIFGLILMFDYKVDLKILPLALMLLYNGKYIISNPDGTKWATLSRSIKLSRLTTTTEKFNLYT